MNTYTALINPYHQASSTPCSSLQGGHYCVDFIQSNKDDVVEKRKLGVGLISRVLQVALSTYFEARDRAPSARALSDAVIGAQLFDQRVKTTSPDPTATRHPDLVKRDFPATAPNRLWVTNLTFVSSWAGVAYVCFIIDAYSRNILAWRVSSNMKTETVFDAIDMARWSRGKHLPG